MARGWESKSVEQRQAELDGSNKPARRALSSAEQKVERQREGLLLTRTNLLRQLEASNHPMHRQMLQRSLAAIDQQLASFETVKEASTPK